MIDRRKWLDAVNAATLPQSAKRYAGWLITRPVKGAEDEYKAGQEAAAQKLGFSVRTAHNAETTLVDKGWMRRARRGTRRSNYSTFVILDARYNMQKVQVADDLQHEHGGRLYVVPQPANFACSMTSEPLRPNRRVRFADVAGRAARPSREQTEKRSERRAGSNFLVAATSRNVTLLERTVTA